MATRRRRKTEEEHENEERWLITYADMITLLMALFIILFSIGRTDLAKFEKLREGLAQSFGTAQPMLSGGSGLLEGGPQLDAESLAALELIAQQEAAARAEQYALRQTRDQIQASLEGQGLGDKVTYRLEARGLILNVVTDEVLFDLGRADLRPDGRQVLDGVVTALRNLPNHISVEGHTDNRPIRGGRQFATNWELSTGRATSVLRYFVEQHGLPSDRVSAAGYADQRPIAPNDSEPNQARNRRVEIVVVAQAQEAKEAQPPSGGRPAPPIQEGPS